MYVYLQPFHTKQLIDDANAELRSRGKEVSYDEALTTHVSYAVATITGVAQTVYYLALWVITTLASFCCLGLWKTLDRKSDDNGTLAVASAIATCLAVLGTLHPFSAAYLSDKIVDYVDASFRDMLTLSLKNLKDEAATLSASRRAHAVNRDDQPRPEAYYNPAVNKMKSKRSELIWACRRVYPRAINERCEAYRSTHRKLREMSLGQSKLMRAQPYSQREIDKFLVQKITHIAEDGAATLYHHVQKTWGERVRQWGTKFDREGFCRHCTKLFHSVKMTSRLERCIREVKDSENKDKAFRESERELRHFLSDMTSRVTSMDRPWPWTRGWRVLYPYVSSWKPAQWAESILDPDPAFIAKGR